MKNVIIVAGYCRPNKERCIENIKILKDCFSKINTEILYIGFNNNDSHFIIQNAPIDHVVLLKQVKDSYTLKFFPKVKCLNAKNGTASQANIFRYREKIKIAIDFIKESIPDCTHICLTRPCLRVRFDPAQYVENTYNIFHSDWDYIDDCFGWSNKEIFEKIWDYKDKKVLKNFKVVDSDEEMVKLTAYYNEVKLNILKFHEYIKRLDN